MAQNFEWQQDLYTNWVPLYSYEYFLWNQMPTPYYRLDLSQLYTQPSTIQITDNFIMIPTQSQTSVFMQDFDPNNRIYIYEIIDVAWEHRSVMENKINEGINQWDEQNRQVLHVNEMIPQYGDLLYNPYDAKWRYFMITNVEPWITESFFLCELRRVNYNITVEPVANNPSALNNNMIPPQNQQYVKIITNPITSS